MRAFGDSAFYDRAVHLSVFCLAIASFFVVQVAVGRSHARSNEIEQGLHDYLAMTQTSDRQVLAQQLAERDWQEIFPSFRISVEPTLAGHAVHLALLDEVSR